MNIQGLFVALCATYLLTSCTANQPRICSAPDVLQVLRSLAIGHKSAESDLQAVLSLSGFSAHARGDNTFMCEAQLSISPSVVRSIKKIPGAARQIEDEITGPGKAIHGPIGNILSANLRYVVREQETAGSVTKNVTLTNFSLAKSRALNTLLYFYKASKTISKFSPPAVLSWSAHSDGSMKIYVGGGLRIIMTSRQTGQSDIPTPVIEVSDGRHEIAQEGQAGFQNPSAQILVGKFDPTAEGNQVAFATYSGGAHCCTLIDILERHAGRWKALSLGSWDGDPLDTFPRDIDGDGIPDIVLADNRFLYTFGCYACSFPPSLVYNIVGGKIIDHSAAPTLQAFYRSQMIKYGANCLMHENGACAGFVGAAARAGLAEYAWDVMLASYNRSSTWPLPTTCRDKAVAMNCPADLTEQPTNYPSALMAFLLQSDYPITDPPVDTARGPSFHCAGVTNQVLMLVCANPDLQKLDLALASAYYAAKSYSQNSQSLVLSQRAWIKARNTDPPDVQVIANAYGHRIGELLAIAQSEATSDVR